MHFYTLVYYSKLWYDQYLVKRNELYFHVDFIRKLDSITPHNIIKNHLSPRSGAHTMYDYSDLVVKHQFPFFLT